MTLKGVFSNSQEQDRNITCFNYLFHFCFTETLDLHQIFLGRVGHCFNCAKACIFKLLGIRCCDPTDLEIMQGKINAKNTIRKMNNCGDGGSDGDVL